MIAVKLDIVTDTNGDATVVAGLSNRPRRLFAVEWVDGTLADGVDAVLSSVNNPSGVNTTLLTLTDANADAWYFPRELMDDNAGGALTAVYDHAVVPGDLQVVVSNGGNVVSGALIAYLLE